MDADVYAEIEDLRQMKVSALRAKYREVCGEEPRSSNKQLLFSRIAWRLQANIQGDLSERARRRALEIADDADLRILAPVGFFIESAFPYATKTLPRAGAGRDRRLPAPGMLLTRQFENRRIVVKVLETGLEYQSQQYRSLRPLPARLPALAGMDFSLDSRSDAMVEVPEKRRTVHCAVYTSKSTEEGLDQEFNSLQAQREAAEAYIKSQRHLGWTLLPTASPGTGGTHRCNRESPPQFLRYHTLSNSFSSLRLQTQFRAVPPVRTSLSLPVVRNQCPTM